MKMCPHCGELFPDAFALVPTHDYPKPCRSVCPGSGQGPRNPETDRRTLWSGEPNPHLPKIGLAPVIQGGNIVSVDLVQVDSDGFPVAVSLGVPEELLNDSRIPTPVFGTAKSFEEVEAALLRGYPTSRFITVNEFRAQHGLPPLMGPRGEERLNPDEGKDGVFPMPFTVEEAEAAGLFVPGAFVNGKPKAPSMPAELQAGLEVAQSFTCGPGGWKGKPIPGCNCEFCAPKAILPNDDPQPIIVDPE